jgi:hypothetical protein
MGQTKKNPSLKAGVVSLFAVTHQGPAQGGKAGGSELPAVNLTKFRPRFKQRNEIFCNQRDKTLEPLHF